MRLAVLALLVLPLAAQAAPASPEGHWARGDGKAKVVIEPCGGDICAINTWIRPDVKDEHVGDKLVMTVAAKGDKWTGKAFDPQRNLRYGMTMTVAGDKMTTSGCVFGGLICKSMNWSRID